MFKCTVLYQPYFLIGCKANTEGAVEEWLMRKYEGLLQHISRERKDDLKLPNHLLGHQRTFLKLSFHNVNDLLNVRRELLPLATEAQKKLSAVDTYADVVSATAAMDIVMEEESNGYDQEEDGWTGASVNPRAKLKGMDPEECIIDIREYDVPYYLRVAIDNREWLRLTLLCYER